MEEEKLLKLNPDEELLKVYEERIALEQSLKKQKKAEKKADGIKPETKVETAEKRKLVNANGTKEDVAKKMKKETGSVQNNPNLPPSVKSIFTSSEQAKQQPRAHWVTHNPLYYWMIDECISRKFMCIKIIQFL